MYANVHLRKASQAAMRKQPMRNGQNSGQQAIPRNVQNSWQSAILRNGQKQLATNNIMQSIVCNPLAAVPKHFMGM